MLARIVHNKRDIIVNTDCFCVSIGEVSLIDILEAAAELTGPAEIDIATWTVGMDSLQRLRRLQRNTRRVRVLVDRSYGTRHPTYAARLLETLGEEFVRIAPIHAKFIALRGDEMQILISTSMNFNRNLRYESFSVHHDAEAVYFCAALLDEWFADNCANWRDKRGVMDRFVRMHSAPAQTHEDEGMFDGLLADIHIGDI